jgi:hypothetical protein
MTPRAKVEPFMTGFVENNTYLGRPVDFLDIMVAR